jgi:hypothetical protein
MSGSVALGDKADISKQLLNRLDKLDEGDFTEGHELDRKSE